MICLRLSGDAGLSETLEDTFPFMGLRCERVTEQVIARLQDEGLVRRT